VNADKGSQQQRRVLSCVLGDDAGPAFFAMVDERGDLLDQVLLPNIKNTARAHATGAGK